MQLQDSCVPIPPARVTVGLHFHLLRLGPRLRLQLPTASSVTRRKTNHPYLCFEPEAAVDPVAGAVPSAVEAAALAAAVAVHRLPRHRPGHRAHPADTAVHSTVHVANLLMSYSSEDHLLALLPPAVATLLTSSSSFRDFTTRTGGALNTW